MKKSKEKTKNPSTKLGKSQYFPKMAGFGYQSPAVVFLFSTNIIGTRTIMVTDEVPREDIREAIHNRHGEESIVFIVCGARNLKKLGPLTKEEIKVSVHDDPEILDALRANIRIVDAKQAVDGSWGLITPQPTIAGIQESIKAAGYRPIHPTKIDAVLRTTTAIIPQFSKDFDPMAALKTLFGCIQEKHQEACQLAIWRFLAGITSRRSISGAKRVNITRLEDGKNPEEFKQLWANVQMWIESDEEGRMVAAAYQLLSEKKIKSTAIAAARMGADLGVLNALVRFIPPSRKIIFAGWKYQG